MKKQSKAEIKFERKPINKPKGFIEYLEILNSLPKNLEDFLIELSFLSDKYIYWRKKEKYENLNMDGADEDQYTYNKLTQKLYDDFFLTLPDKVKEYLGGPARERATGRINDWLAGERKLNMLAIERESIELIISQWKKEKAMRQDFERETGKTDEESFQKFMWANRFSDKYKQHVYNFYMPLPSVNYRLKYHRVMSGIERTGFKGFLTHLTETKGFLDVAAEGLIGIVLKQKLNGEPPIELDRLGYCGFCRNFIYAYKGNQEFCSKKCGVANYQRKRRNNKIELLRKEMKEETGRLDNLRNRLDGGNGLVAEQEQRVKNLQKQIEAEENK